ncbi:MAG: formylglycine-generating enzyme family protein [Phycisphaerales bacterium]|nr:formylglycine-generating enzyme family protein [Phycisphaerales bacterium]
MAHSHRAELLALAALAVGSCVAFAQPSGPPAFYAPGAGQRATWNPVIPLSPTAQANLAATGGGVTSDYGLDFVTVNLRGNPGYVAGQYPNDGGGSGLGAVDGSFRIARTEVPTALWVDFFNAASYVGATQGVIPFLQLPSGWGAVNDSAYTGPGQRWVVASSMGPTAPNQAGYMIPVGDISWRTAAIFCNWLNNDRALTREAFMNGAYDVSTFGFATGGFSDQVAHNPGARFFIPTQDQWVAAAHYDPSRANGDGTTGGYWVYPTTSDTAPVYLPPELGGEANAAFNRQGRVWTVGLGDYPTVQSPWGLLDAAGGSSEWLETPFYQENALFPSSRLNEGSGRFDTPWSDPLWVHGGAFPSEIDWTFGLRIAASMPTPSSGCLLAWVAAQVLRRRCRFAQ